MDTINFLSVIMKEVVILKVEAILLMLVIF